MSKITISKTHKASPFFDLGHRWVYSCGACGCSGGAATKPEIDALSRRHASTCKQARGGGA